MVWVVLTRFVVVLVSDNIMAKHRAVTHIWVMRSVFYPYNLESGSSGGMGICGSLRK